MNDCIFCQIIASHTGIIWESDTVVAFPDKYPDAPVHILVVPKQHIASLDQLDDPILAGELLMAVSAVASQTGIAGAYRTIINTGRDGGQIINHLHIHVMGGKSFAREPKGE